MQVPTISTSFNLLGTSFLSISANKPDGQLEQMAYRSWITSSDTLGLPLEACRAAALLKFTALRARLGDSLGSI
jgi:hypothetical protein